MRAGDVPFAGTSEESGRMQTSLMVRSKSMSALSSSPRKEVRQLRTTDSQACT
jgi:hypothetical protein